MLKVKSLIIIFLSLLLSTTNLIAQNKDFNKGLSLFNAQNYPEAIKVFAKVKDDSLNSNAEVANIFYIKCLLNTNQLQSASKEIIKFEEAYNDSKNLQEIEFCIADLEFRQKNYLSSALTLLKNIEKDNSNYSKEKFEEIVVNYFNDDLIKKLKDSLFYKKLIPDYTLASAKYYIYNNRIDEALNLLNEIKTLYSGEKIIKEADELLNDYENRFIIGVLLPLNSNDEIVLSEADDILKGIRLAVNLYNKENDIKVGLLVKSIQDESDYYAKLKKELLKTPGLCAIIGPIYSKDIKNMSKEFKDFQIPIFSPTATDFSLTDLFKNFYQANIPFELRAKAMANFIYNNEHKRAIAVIFPTEKYGKILSDSFITEFQDLGGKVMFMQAYKSGTYFYDNILDKLTTNTEFFEGIYCPIIDKADGPSILNILNQAGITQTIYGDQDWSLVNPQSFRDYFGSIIVTTDYYVETGTQDYWNFYSEYSKYYSKQVKKNVLYGYDLLNYLVKQVGLRNLRQKMFDLEGKNFNGIHINIKFKNRINHIINILRLTANYFELIDRYEIN
ncbi:MAG: ABC transporter substrate-binding protein [Syntrophothermus sp.]